MPFKLLSDRVQFLSVYVNMHTHFHLQGPHSLQQELSVIIKF